jgi:hypothetical protein
MGNVAKAKSATDDRVAIRQSEAVRLRVAGKTFQEIGKALGVSNCQAHKDVRAVTDKLSKRSLEDAEMERELQLGRIDAGIQVVFGILEGRRTPSELKLKALDRLVTLEKRRAELLGLDAPKRQEIDAKVSGSATPAEAARLVREAFGEHALRKPEADAVPDPQPVPEGASEA